MKSIEVIRGPSVLFGRNTLGGAINIITRRGEPTRELVPELEGGSFGRVSYRLRASGPSTRLPHLTHPPPGRRLPGLHALAALTRIRQAGRPRGRARRHRVLPVQQQPPQAGRVVAPELHLAVVNVRDRLTDHLTMEGNAFVRDLSVEQFNVNAAGENSRLINHTRSVGGRIQTSYDQRLFGHDNVLIAGAEYTRHDVTSRTFQEGPGSRSLEASLADGQDAVGAYLQDSLALARGFAGPRSSVIMTAAGRWDLLRHRIDDRLGGPSGGTHAFQRVNPGAGINANLSEHVGAFVSYGEGFRAPAFLELTCAGPGAVCPGLQVGVAPDPPLKAVKARTYEIGVYARPVAWLDLSATVYRSDVQNNIFAVAPTRTTGVFFQNIGGTRRQGVEASARGRAGGALDFYLNYAYTEATFEDRVELATPLPPGSQTVAAGRSFALVPRHRANAGLIYRPWPWLGLGLDVRYVSSQFPRGDEVNRQAPLPGFWVVDAGITIKQRGLEAFLKVNNVLDNRYETFGTSAPNAREAGAPVERFLTPAPPVLILAGVRYTF